MNFLRNEQTRTSSSLSFSIASDGQCEIKLWPQEVDNKLGGSRTQAKPCTRAGTLEFKEMFNGLRTDTLYAAEIKAWKAGEAPEQADVYVAYETRTNGLGHVINANFNLTQQALQVRDLDNSSLKLWQMYRNAKPIEGCQLNKELEVEKLNELHKIGAHEIKRISLSGQINAETTGQLPPSLLSFNGLNANNTLSVRVESAASNSVYNSSALGKIVSAKVDSPKSLNLEKNELTAATDAIEIGQGDGLKISWQTSRQTPQSFVRLAIGPADTGITCFFEAEKGSANIPPDAVFNSLARGSFDAHLSFVFQTVSLFDSPNVWFVTAQDWRSFRIERI